MLSTKTYVHNIQCFAIPKHSFIKQYLKLLSITKVKYYPMSDCKLYTFGQRNFKTLVVKQFIILDLKYCAHSRKQCQALKIPTSILLMSLLERNSAMASSVEVAGAVQEKYQFKFLLCLRHQIQMRTTVCTLYLKVTEKTYILCHDLYPNDPVSRT